MSAGIQQIGQLQTSAAATLRKSTTEAFPSPAFQLREIALRDIGLPGQRFARHAPLLARFPNAAPEVPQEHGIGIGPAMGTRWA